MSRRSRTRPAAVPDTSARIRTSFRASIALSRTVGDRRRGNGSGLYASGDGKPVDLADRDARRRSPHAGLRANRRGRRRRPRLQAVEQRRPAAARRRRLGHHRRHRRRGLDATARLPDGACPAVAPKRTRIAWAANTSRGGGVRHGRGLFAGDDPMARLSGRTTVRRAPERAPFRPGPIRGPPPSDAGPPAVPSGKLPTRAERECGELTGPSGCEHRSWTKGTGKREPNAHASRLAGRFATTDPARKCAAPATACCPQPVRNTPTHPNSVTQPARTGYGWHDALDGPGAGAVLADSVEPHG